MAKGKDPAFLFYPEAFLVGTMDMTDKEAGRYIRLLCKQHAKGHLKETDLKNTTEEVRSKFTKAEDGFYYNARLCEEIDKRQKFTESRRKNGAAGGRPKKDETEAEEEDHIKTTSKPNENHMVINTEPNKNHIKNTNKNTNKNKNTDKYININTSDISQPMQAVIKFRRQMGREA